MTPLCLRSIFALTVFALAWPAAGQRQESAIERYERQSGIAREAQEKVNRAAIEPVVAALKRGTKNDPEMQALLSQIRLTATPHLMRPGNAYATRTPRELRGGTVEVDLGFFQQANAIGDMVGIMGIDSDTRKIGYRVFFKYGQSLRAALDARESFPNFSFTLNDYVTDPLELSFVQGLGHRVTEEAMAWTLLHEVAHHQLGHLRPEYRYVAKAASRQMELDADAWAFRKMVELNIPLYGAMQFMQAMSTLDQVYAAMGLPVAEEDSTHPSWERRLEQLTRAYDPVASTRDNWLLFSTPLNLARAGARPDIKRIVYAFPRDPAGFGACMGLVQLGAVQEFAAVERRNQSMHLYQSTPGQQIEVQIVDPHRTLTPVVTTVTDRATGAKTQGTMVAWQQPVALYGEEQKDGVRVGDMMAMAPKAVFRGALEQTVTNPAARSAATASFERKLTAECQIVIGSGKGLFDAQETMRRAQAVTAKYIDELKSILGEADYARFQARVLSGPLVQAGLRQAQKLMEQNQQALRDVSVPVPGAATPFRYVNSADNLRALFREIDDTRQRGDTRRAGELTRSLFPDETRLRRGLRDGVSSADVGRILALHDQHRPRSAQPAEWAQVLGREPAHTEIQVHGATREEIAANRPGSVVEREFPGGAVGLAPTLLRPGLSYYEVEFVPPGSSSGMKYHLFYWDGEQWAMLGPVWRAFR